jgi:hypothetical protein
MRARHVFWRRLGYAWLGFALILLALTIAAVALGLFGPEDRCLDAGGRWIAEEQRCEGARPGG